MLDRQAQLEYNATTSSKPKSIGLALIVALVKLVDYLSFIYYNLPETVRYLIKKGADVNLKNGNYRGYPENKPYAPTFNAYYNQIPFALAFNKSPQSALILLEQPGIDMELIKENLPNSFPDYLAMSNYYQEYSKVIEELIGKGIDPNTTVTVWMGKFHIALTSSLLGLMFNAIHLASTKESANIPHIISDHIAIIKLLLEHGAKINTQYFEVNSGSLATPLEFVEKNKDQYPELYELIQNYKNSTNNL